MNRTGSALATAVALSCASTGGERQSQQKPAASQASAAAQPAPPQAPPGGGAPMTAAEAADTAHREWIRTRERRDRAESPK